MPFATRTILDSRQPFDAGLLGYDHPVDPSEDGEGLIVRGEAAAFSIMPSVALIGPDGVVELFGRSEIEQVIKALQWALDPAAAAREAAA